MEKGWREPEVMWGAEAKVDRGGRAAPGRIMRRHASVHPPTSLWLGLGGVLCPEVGEGDSRVYNLLLILVYENWYQGPEGAFYLPI